MSIAVAEFEPETVASPDRPKAGNPDRVRQFDAAIRLAWFLTKPVEFLNEAHCKIDPFGADVLKSLARHREFRRPINRSLASAMGFGAGKIRPETIAKLAVSPELRLGTVLLTAPMAETRNIALMIAAAVLSKRVRGLVLKSDRHAMQEALGIDGFDIAIQEAPLLYPLLTALDRTPADYPLFRIEVPLNERQEFAIGLGFQVIGRFFDAVEPNFADLYSKRLPPNTSYINRSGFVSAFDEAQCNQFVRLIRRRQKKWSDIIG